MLSFCVFSLCTTAVYRDFVYIRSINFDCVFFYFAAGLDVTRCSRALKIKYEAEQKEMARLQGFVDRFGAQASASCT